MTKTTTRILTTGELEFLRLTSPVGLSVARTDDAKFIIGLRWESNPTLIEAVEAALEHISRISTRDQFATIVGALEMLRWETEPADPIESKRRDEKWFLHWWLTPMERRMLAARWARMLVLNSERRSDEIHKVLDTVEEVARGNLQKSDLDRGWEKMEGIIVESRNGHNTHCQWAALHACTRNEVNAAGRVEARLQFALGDESAAQIVNQDILDLLHGRLSL